MNRYLIAAAVTLFAVIGLYRYGFHKGWGERDAEMQAEIARKNAEARETEHKLNAQINASAVQLSEANNAINQKQSDLDRAIRAGRVRLPAPSCVPAASSAPAPAGDRNEARGQPDPAPDQPSDSDRATLAAIAEIVAQADRNTAQLNACIDAYNSVREQINGSKR